MTLSEFLLARFAEDEAIARAAVIPAWEGGQRSQPELAEWTYADGAEVEYVQTPEMLAEPYPQRLYVTCDGEGLTPAVEESVGPHIARHDPARVLAECEAKRRIVTLHDAALRAELANGDASAYGADLMHSDVLRLLALLYADHPDYRDEWRP